MLSLRSALTSLTVAAIFLQPVTALAAFTSPSELSQGLIPSLDRPLSRTLTVTGTVEGIHANIVVQGVSEEMQTLSKAKGRISADVDIEGSDVALHIKLQATLHKKTVYLRVAELAGRGEQWNTFQNDAFAKFIGQWIAIPLTISDEEYAKVTSEGDVSSLGVNVAMLNDFFTLHHERFRAGHAYTLTLRPDLADYIVAKFGMSGANAEHVRSVLANLSFHMKVDTNNQDALQYGLLNISYKNDSEPKGALTLSAKVQRQMTPVYVDVPKKTIPWSEVETALNFSQASMPMVEEGSVDSSVQEQASQPEETTQTPSEAREQDIDLSLLPLANANLPIIDLVGPSGRRHIRVPVQVGTEDAKLSGITEGTAVLYIENNPGVTTFPGVIQDSLEVLFFDSYGKLLGSAVLDACSEGCTAVQSPRATKYTLQVLPGFMQKYGIRLGWRMMFHDEKDTLIPAGSLQQMNRIRLCGAHELNLADQPSKYDGDDLVVAPENQRLVTLGKIVAAQIRTGDLRTLVGKDRGDRGDFISISEQLRIIKAKNPWLKDLFIVRATGAPGVVEVVVAPEMMSLKEAIAAGQDTWEIPAITEHPDRAVSFSLRDDAGKKHTYVYIPIFDNNGAVVGGVVLE